MRMENYRTQFDTERIRFHCPAGKRVEIRHNPRIDKDGRRELIPDKKVAVWDLIQSHKEECEIENIVRRAVEGDAYALNAREGIYADITNCPSSIAEAQQFIINQKEEFDKLPKDIKQKFEYNAEMYVAEMSQNTQSWFEKMGFKEEAERYKAEQEAAQKVQENTAKAMENLANGTLINNPKGDLGNE